MVYRLALAAVSIMELLINVDVELRAKRFGGVEIRFRFEEKKQFIDYRFFDNMLCSFLSKGRQIFQLAHQFHSLIHHIYQLVLHGS